MNLQLARICLTITIALGVFMTFLGVMVIPVLPHFQLDVVLTQEELRDEATREATLQMLKRAAGNQWLFWTAPGLILIVVGGVGRLALRTTFKSNDAITSSN